MLAFTTFGVDIAYSAIGFHLCHGTTSGSIINPYWKPPKNVDYSCKVYWLVIMCDLAVAACLLLRYRAHFNAQGGDGGDATAYQKHADPGPPASMPPPAQQQQQAAPDYSQQASGGGWGDPTAVTSAW